MTDDILKPGTRLSGGSYGGYTIDRVLGRGGFGVTYCAHSRIGIQFAIKEFFPKYTCERDPVSNQILVSDFSKIDLIGRLQRRFLDEAENIARCEHPNIVHVVESFEENGTAYMVMEHVEGITLQNYIKTHGPMDQIKAREIIIKVALALNYIHNRKMTHLDIKPDNIMLLPSGEPVIIDFGQSRQHNEGPAADTEQITAVSKGYTAPEQYSRHLSQTFRPESDVYSLGATYYYMLNGRKPGEPLQGHDFGGELPANVSPNIRQAISEAMTYNPKDRTRSMTTFIGNVRGKLIKEVDLSSGTAEQLQYSWPWNILLCIVIALCMTYIAVYWSESSFYLTSRYIFYLDKDALMYSLGATALIAFIGLVSSVRWLKITMAILSAIASAMLIINFEMS